MLYKELIELFDVLDSASASGSEVVEYFRSIDPMCQVETYPLEGPKGHTDMVRILIPGKNGKLLFVEKLSFSLPYQVLRFDNRKQLNRYLMSMYDTQWGQDSARPFVMENTQLLY